MAKQFHPPQAGTVIPFQGKTYTIGNALGTGYFGKVHACFDDWGNSLAAKVLVPQNQTYEEVEQSWLRELTNLANLRHPNVTYIHDAFEFNDTFYLIIERCDYPLRDLIAWPQLKGEVWIEPVARCVLQAIHFMHSVGYVHKDLHPGNIFAASVVDEMNPWKEASTTFKVGDLGITRLLSDVDFFNTVLAPWMVPPEFLKPAEFGLLGWNVDIYHAGLLFLALLLGTVPSFTHQQILDGVPRQTAENLASPYTPAIARALRRHVADRTPTALDFWRDLLACSSAAPHSQ